MNDRSWAMKHMRENSNTKYTKSEMALYYELKDNCFDDMDKVPEIMIPQYIPTLHSVEGIRVTNPPPQLDIAIPEIKLCFRVMGQVHESPTAKRKDWLQKAVLEGNGWMVEDVWFWEREDLWK